RRCLDLQAARAHGPGQEQQRSTPRGRTRGRHRRSRAQQDHRPQGERSGDRWAGRAHRQPQRQAGQARVVSRFHSTTASLLARGPPMNLLLALFPLMLPVHGGSDMATSKGLLTLTQREASAFAKLALRGTSKEYPNKPGIVLNSEADVLSPRALHPAFYGCFDWHSAVHGHWMLVRLLRMFPQLPQKDEIRAVMKEHLTARNLKAEAD